MDGLLDRLLFSSSLTYHNIFFHSNFWVYLIVTIIVIIIIPIIILLSMTHEFYTITEKKDKLFV